MQSKKELRADRTFKVHIGLMRYGQRGGGKQARKITNISLTDPDNSIRKKRSMVFVPDFEVGETEF